MHRPFKRIISKPLRAQKQAQSGTAERKRQIRKARLSLLSQGMPSLYDGAEGGTRTRTEHGSKGF